MFFLWKKSIRSLTFEQYNKMIATATPIMVVNNIPKVLITNDNKIIKLFNVKRKVSTAQVYPYIIRFMHNTEKLHQRNIPTVKIIEGYYVPGHNIEALIYDYLEGTPFDKYIESCGNHSNAIKQFINFLAHIHKKGVYFKGVHFGNIIVLENKSFGLIDTANMTIKRRSLSVWHRARNFRIFAKHATDMTYLNEFGLDNFVNEYLEESKIRGGRKKLFMLFLLTYSYRFWKILKKTPNPT